VLLGRFALNDNREAEGTAGGASPRALSTASVSTRDALSKSFIFLRQPETN
jgi:hypothetical protein